MLNRELVIIGGGPAGLCAALNAAKSGQSSLIIERSPMLGGQLIKQTHMFFGSEKQYAKSRGFEIAEKLIEEVRKSPLIEVWVNTTALGLYEDKVLTVLKEEEYLKLKADAYIIATGASEKSLAFENNDLPGVYGAGAVQTLMNVYGVKPGHKIIMVGSGNIGLIVSYQLLQAGVKVIAVVEASSKIGGYKVHAAKLRRYGIPIYINTTIKKAIGKDFVEKVETIKLDDNFEFIPGTEQVYDVDAVCVAVGLSPLSQLLTMVGCEMKYVSELGGVVPVLSDKNETSIPGIYACGDVCAIEEASSAIVEGYLTGLVASKFLGKVHPEYDKLIDQYKQELTNLRSGPFGKKLRDGFLKLKGESNAL